MTITVKSPSAFDAAICEQLQDVAIEKYKKGFDAVERLELPVRNFLLKFQEMLEQGYSYDLNKPAGQVYTGAIYCYLTKPLLIQEEEIVVLKEKAKQEYIDALEAEKQHQIKLLAEQQLATHLRKEEEKKQRELAKLKAQFEADAVACFANIRTSDE